MNKKILYIIPIVILIVAIIFLIYPKEEKGKFYLDDKYYNNGEFIEVNKLPRGTYIAYVYANVCIFPTPCDKIFKEVMEKYKIDMLEISFDDIRDTKYHKEVIYAPSALIIRNGKLIAYLDAESDIDLEKYQDASKFEEWLSNYIYLEKN